MTSTINPIAQYFPEVQATLARFETSIQCDPTTGQYYMTGAGTNRSICDLATRTFSIYIDYYPHASFALRISLPVNFRGKRVNEEVRTFIMEKALKHFPTPIHMLKGNRKLSDFTIAQLDAEYKQIALFMGEVRLWDGQLAIFAT